MAATREDLRMMCSLNGWVVGTQLRRTANDGETYDMEITALGEDAVLIKYLSHDIQGEAVLFAGDGDVFTEILTRDRILTEVVNLSNRITYLLKQLSEEAKGGDVQDVQEEVVAPA